MLELIIYQYQNISAFPLVQLVKGGYGDPIGNWEWTDYKLAGAANILGGAGFPSGVDGDGWLELTNYRKRSINPLIETYFSELLQAVNPAAFATEFAQ